MEKRIYNEKSWFKCVCIVSLYILSTLFIMYKANLLLRYFSYDDLNKYLDLIYYSFFMVLCIILFRKELLECCKDIGRNAIDRITLTGIIFIVALLLIVATGILIDKMGFGKSENQSNIEEWVETSKMISLITVIFIGPFAEEFVFRGSFYGIIRGTGDKKLRGIIAIIISGIVFGGIHMSHFTVEEFVLCLPLMLEGMCIGYLYYKTDNILCCMAVHMGMNALASK